MGPKPGGLAELFQIRKIKFGRCLEPSMQCREPAIQAHSIQNAQVIELLQQGGHVYAWQPRSSASNLDVELRQIGRNRASVFAGFCSQHDTEIFQPIDTRPLDCANHEQLFLLAYRGITCELHAIMTWSVQLQSLYKARIERGLDSPDCSSPAGELAMKQMLLSWAAWRYRQKYYCDPLRHHTADSVQHHVIFLNDQNPSLAVSSFITLKDAPIDQDLAGVAINILPISKTTTVAVFSFATQDRRLVSATLDRVFGSTGDTQKYELSKLILSRVSNVLFSPRQINRWSPEKMRKVTEAFVQTVKSQQDVGEDPGLMLF
jgi:hypothetical protein